VLRLMVSEAAPPTSGESKFMSGVQHPFSAR
jgi:hypothetical protein